MDICQFSFSVERLAELTVSEKIEGEERKYFLLLDKVYYNLCLYQEFNWFMHDKRAKPQLPKLGLVDSPFKSSYAKYRQMKTESG